MGNLTRWHHISRFPYSYILRYGQITQRVCISIVIAAGAGMPVSLTAFCTGCVTLLRLSRNLRKKGSKLFHGPRKANQTPMQSKGCKGNIDQQCRTDIMEH